MMAQYGWLLAPAIALLLGVFTLVPLGVQVLRRGVVFMDLAVAQMAASCVLAWNVWQPAAQTWQQHAAAVIGALLAVALVALCSRRWPAEREALIGLLYVAGASLALLLASSDAHGQARLTAMLAADVLWAAWQPIALLAIDTVLVAALAGFSLANRDIFFYPVFALALSMAVPLFGLYLLFALLIAPALWQRRGWRLRVCLLAAACSCALGMAVSWWLDLPSGVCIALALCLLGLGNLLLPAPAHHRIAE